jgi:hypothetical protein
MRGKRRVTYLALLLDRHHILFANGAAVESLRPGPVAMANLPRRDRRAIAALYPGLRVLGDMALGPPACPILRTAEARVTLGHRDLSLGTLGHGHPDAERQDFHI